MVFHYEVTFVSCGNCRFAFFLYFRFITADRILWTLYRTLKRLKVVEIKRKQPKSPLLKHPLFFEKWWCLCCRLWAQSVIVVHIFPRITVTGLFLSANHGITHTVLDYRGWQVNMDVITIHFLIPILISERSSHQPSLLWLLSALSPMPVTCTTGPFSSLWLRQAIKCLNDPGRRDWFQREAVSPLWPVNANHRFEVLKSFRWQIEIWIKGKLQALGGIKSVWSLSAKITVVTDICSHYRATFSLTMTHNDRWKTNTLGVSWEWIIDHRDHCSLTYQLRLRQCFLLIDLWVKTLHGHVPCQTEENFRVMFPVSAESWLSVLILGDITQSFSNAKLWL